MRCIIIKSSIRSARSHAAVPTHWDNARGGQTSRVRCLTRPEWATTRPRGGHMPVRVLLLLPCIAHSTQVKQRPLITLKPVQGSGHPLASVLSAFGAFCCLVQAHHTRRPATKHPQSNSTLKHLVLPNLVVKLSLCTCAPLQCHACTTAVPSGCTRGCPSPGAALRKSEEGDWLD